MLRRSVLQMGMAAPLDVSAAFSQSKHAKKIMESFLGTRYESYATDMAINKPGYVVFTPKQNRFVMGDTYNDHFHVFDKPGGSLFAAWTQATVEADIDQHIAFSWSTDKGLTSSEPVVLAGSKNYTNPQLRASWQQPMVSRSGRIYVLWNQQVTSRGPHCGNMFGIYSLDNGATWSSPKMVPMKRMDRDPGDPAIPPSWCNWQRPLRLGKGGKYLVGVSRHGKLPHESKIGCTVEFLQYDNIDDDPEVQDIHLSWFLSND